MTNDELERGKEMLLAAFEARVEASELYVKALEFVLPLVGGDTECLRDARRIQCRHENFVNTAKVAFKDASEVDLIETFRVYRGSSD